ncbi:hypothetical protein XM25_19575 [Devosia sp. H5989]|nr:hypothetical protein XM25_19575 [Devosia sp. H5989]
MYPSHFDSPVATLSSVTRRPQTPMLFIDLELEALFRAGRVSERPSLLAVVAVRVWHGLAGVLTSAAARRAVL